jgi:hypothetical protein
MKEKPKTNPLPITTKRLFFDMMDAAAATGMPCVRINLVHDAIRAMDDALKGVIECPDYRDISTLQMRAACKARHDWNGGNHAEKA